MGLPAKLLADGERLLLVLHPHVRRLARPALILLVLVPVASYATAAVPAGSARPTLRLVLAVVAAAVAVRWVVWPYLLWWNTVYVLTDQRIFERQGIVRRYGHDLPLRGVTDVVVAQRLTERLLGSGTLSVTTEGGAELTVRDVPAVTVLQRSLLAVADDVTARDASPRRLPRAELGEPDADDAFDDRPGDEPDEPDEQYDGEGYDGEGYDGEGHDGEGHDGEGHDDEPDDRGGAPGRREARRREREPMRRLREIQAEVRRTPAPAEAPFESLLDAGEQGGPGEHGVPAGPAAVPGREAPPGDDEPPEGARILRFPRRP